MIPVASAADPLPVSAVACAGGGETYCLRQATHVGTSRPCGQLFRTTVLTVNSRDYTGGRGSRLGLVRRPPGAPWRHWSKGFTLLVALCRTTGGRVVGFAPAYATMAICTRFLFMPDISARGIGSLLLARMEAYCRRLWCGLRAFRGEHHRPPLLRAAWLRGGVPDRAGRPVSCG